jgi:hypothetical protein
MVAVVAFVLCPRADRLTRENYDCIREGMSRAEVEAILGLPGDRSSGPLQPIGPRPHWHVLDTGILPDSEGRIAEAFRAEGQTVEEDEWRNDHLIVRVYFFPNSIVWGMNHQEVALADRPALDNLLWRAKRLWRKWFPDKPEGP